MLVQSYAVNEVKVGVEYFLRGMSAQHAYQKSHDALHNQCVALGLELNDSRLLAGSFLVVGLQPYTALASVYQILFGLILLVQRLLFIAHVYELLIPIHPVVQPLELLNNLVLYLVNCHGVVSFFCLVV